MCKKLQSMFAGTPLINNLENPDYMKGILNGKDLLAERLAEIDHNRISDKTKGAREVESKVSEEIKQLIRKRNQCQNYYNCWPVNENPRGF